MVFTFRFKTTWLFTFITPLVHNISPFNQILLDLNTIKYWGKNKIYDASHLYQQSQQLY